jgi:molybdopterin-containing oxidoreductase family iron-sulfur binding subunit
MTTKPATHNAHSGDVDRRAALQWLASGAALALASCGRPPEEIVPYVEMPERLTPGIPLQFATALSLAGFARGVIVTSVEGRPIKVEGNPRHPASLGATDVFAQASVLTLYDPDRAKAVRRGDQIVSWSAFESAFRPRLEQARARQGAGLRILTSRITSPTLLRQLDTVLTRLPQAKWYRYEPVDDDFPRQGAAAAFGQQLTVNPRFADARVVLALDADPIGTGPEQVRFANDMVAVGRSKSADEFLRLYAVEPSWSLTGAAADHRLALAPPAIRDVALSIANHFGADLSTGNLPPEATKFAAAVAADLKARPGQAMVIVGRRQPAEVHALCHWINAQLRAPIDFITPIDPATMGHVEALRALSDEVDSKTVETLLVIDANPAYDAPRDFGLADAIASVPFSTHLGIYDDETAARCTFRLPRAHELESWSDLRAFDGTASIVQPLIRPLYDTRSPHEVLAMISGPRGSAHDLVRDTWQQEGGANFDGWWRQSLHDGVIADSRAMPVPTPVAKLPDIAPAASAGGLSLVLAPDPSLWDGGFANNAWLQECPKPLTKQVWGNALHLSPNDAREFGLVDGDVVRLTVGGRVLEGPVLVRAGHADKVIEATLGLGRANAGAIGNRVGFDAYVLRSSRAPWEIENVAMVRLGRAQNLLLAQHHFALEGEAKDLQPRVPVTALAAGKRLFAPGEPLPTLFPPFDYPSYRWGMVIDTTACVGCNACVVACQAENNVPIVGPDEIALGRDMHWLRVDVYTVDGQPGFSPVPCMHCEQAPCEPVCPVAASVHDSEGLNVQVYNRCVGTRFCESNCPYKVRRFNFFGYADGEGYASFGAEPINAVFNPDVTVRSRGVMEKCTYCVQRISRARRAAEKEDRRIADGEVVTACQGACPTRAISFGDLNDRASRVNVARAEPHLYELLGHLGTRPRTAYLARVRNPNPALGGSQT